MSEVRCEDTNDDGIRCVEPTVKGRLCLEHHLKHLNDTGKQSKRNRFSSLNRRELFIAGGASIITSVTGALTTHFLQSNTKPNSTGEMTGDKRTDLKKELSALRKQQLKEKREYIIALSPSRFIWSKVNFWRDFCQSNPEEYLDLVVEPALSNQRLDLPEENLLGILTVASAIAAVKEPYGGLAERAVRLLHDMEMDKNIYRTYSFGEYRLPRQWYYSLAEATGEHKDIERYSSFMYRHQFNEKLLGPKNYELAFNGEYYEDLSDVTHGRSLRRKIQGKKENQRYDNTEIIERILVKNLRKHSRNREAIDQVRDV